MAEVALTIYVPEINRTAVLTRNIKTAKTFTLNPDEPKIRAAVEETARHPELILSRREIIKYIIVEAGELPPSWRISSGQPRHTEAIFLMT